MLYKKILLIRKRMNITQKEMGLLLGISEQQVHHYEKDKRKPSIRVWHLLIDLGLKVKVKLTVGDWLPVGELKNFNKKYGK